VLEKEEIIPKKIEGNVPNKKRKATVSLLIVKYKKILKKVKILMYLGVVVIKI
jgi:hypothetical protein